MRRNSWDLDEILIAGLIVLIILGASFLPIALIIQYWPESLGYSLLILGGIPLIGLSIFGLGKLAERVTLVYKRWDNKVKKELQEIKEKEPYTWETGELYEALRKRHWYGAYKGKCWDCFTQGTLGRINKKYLCRECLDFEAFKNHLKERDE